MTGPQTKLSKSSSLLIVFLAYVIAIVIGILTAQYFNYQNFLIDVAIADLAATVVIFLFSYGLKNSSMYDPYWSVIPILIALLYLLEIDANDTRQWIIFGLVTFWGLRLTLNWIRGWPGLHHEDWRYVDLAKKNGKLYWMVSFSGIHLFPTILVYGGMIPVLYGMANKAPMNAIDYVATVVTFGAVMIEWISDEQLIKFKQSNPPPGSFIQTGLWAYSRHPNYFGEVSFWVGLFLFGLAKAPQYYWTGLGALAMILLFVFISVPMMDERHKASRDGYEEHMKKVSGLVPWFRKR